MCNPIETSDCSKLSERGQDHVITPNLSDHDIARNPAKAVAADAANCWASRRFRGVQTDRMSSSPVTGLRPPSCHRASEQFHAPHISVADAVSEVNLFGNENNGDSAMFSHFIRGLQTCIPQAMRLFAERESLPPRASGTARAGQCRVGTGSRSCTSAYPFHSEPPGALRTDCRRPLLIALLLLRRSAADSNVSPAAAGRMTKLAEENARIVTEIPSSRSVSAVAVC